MSDLKSDDFVKSKKLIIFDTKINSDEKNVCFQFFVLDDWQVVVVVVMLLEGKIICLSYDDDTSYTSGSKCGRGRSHPPKSSDAL